MSRESCIESAKDVCVQSKEVMWAVVDACWELSPQHTSDQKKCSFTEAIVRTEYRAISEATKEYEVFLYKHKHHWYLLLHNNEDGTNYSYVGLEVTTDKTRELIPAMKILYRHGENLTHSPDGDGEIEDDGKKVLKIPYSSLQKKGSRMTSIMSVCKIADEVRAEMREYKLARSNCQHFTNNILQRLGLVISRTWIGPETTIPTPPACTTCTHSTGGDGGACV
jgi:hypothetical protein